MSENDPRLDATTRIPRPNPQGEQALPPGSYAAPQGGPVYGAPGVPPGGPSYGAPPPGGPPYGAPPPPPGSAQSPYGSPAPAAPGPIRPRVLWIVLAWLFAVVCGIVGVVGFAGGLFKTITDAAPTTTFNSGGSVTVTIDPKDSPILYASASGPTNVTCSALNDADGNKADLTKPKTSQTVTTDGRVWEALFDIGVPATGTYKISCEAQDGKQVLFGVGKSLTADASALAGGVASLFLIPLAGFLVAVITTIVVLVRRSRARKRMAAAPYGGGWPQGAPPRR